MFNQWKRLAAGTMRRLRPGSVKFHVEHVTPEVISGWAHTTDTAQGNLPLGLFAGDTLIVTTCADISRKDVSAVSGGEERCGFEITMTNVLRQRMALSHGRLSLWLLGETSEKLCSIDRLNPPAMTFADVVRPALEALESDTLPARAPLTAHAPMMRHDLTLPGVAESQLPAYLDYARYTSKEDQAHPPAETLEDERAFVLWYLTRHRHRQRLRLPMSARLIADLREGQTVMDWYQEAIPAGDIDPRFRWAEIDAPQLGAEDCLISPETTDWLAEPIGATSRYGQLLRDSSDVVNALPEEQTNLAIMLLALQRPDRLWYLPQEAIDGALEGPLTNFASELLGKPVPLTRDSYRAALYRQKFDLDAMQFLTRDANGNRFEAAAIPASQVTDKVDVQIIGPLSRASGLGQATRVSADTLRQTDLSIRAVDDIFDHVTPAVPTTTSFGNAGPAKINLLHMNAEAVPTALAFTQDVFSEAYNIGYVFWELDRPAYSHFLGMELLDELWVFSDYGVDQFQADFADKPVTKVSMAFEDLPDIERDDARAFVTSRFGLDDDAYVCLFTFDSFSFIKRKNPLATLKAFQLAFSDVDNARLIIKTHNRSKISEAVQVAVWEEIDRIRAADSRILLLDETLAYRDLLRLNAGCDCYVSLHRSEGLGFGMLEAMNLGLPVVCTGYSGNMEFCSDETAWLVDYSLVPVGPDDYIFVREGSLWADPDVAHAARQLRAAYDNPDERAAKAAKALQKVRSEHSVKAVAKRYESRLKEILTKVDAA